MPADVLPVFLPLILITVLGTSKTVKSWIRDSGSRNCLVGLHVEFSTESVVDRCAVWDIERALNVEEHGRSR